MKPLFHCLRIGLDNRGNMLVEVAVFLPVLVLVLLLGTDFIRFMQLSHRADHAAFMAASRLGFTPETDTETLETLRQEVLNLSEFAEVPGTLEIRGRIQEYSAVTGHMILWSETAGDPVAACLMPEMPAVKTQFEEPISVPRQYFSSIQLCFQPSVSYFLTPYFPFRDTPVSAIYTWPAGPGMRGAGRSL